MNLPEIGIVSDEISSDFHDAVRHGLSWGVTRYELRQLVSGRVPAVDESEINQVIQLAREKNLRITAVSPGIFKHPLSRTQELDEELREVLPKTIALAKECGAPIIIVFGFERETDEPADRFQRAVHYMREASARAEKYGVKLAIENEPGFWCDTGVNTARLIREVNSSALGANWDPCNAFGTDERPYPEGYEAIKGAIVNVHAKDTSEGSLIRCVPIGDGVIDWKGQIRALVHDKLVEHITIETHCHPLVENSRRNVQTIRELLSDVTH